MGLSEGHEGTGRPSSAQRAAPGRCGRSGVESGPRGAGRGAPAGAGVAGGRGAPGAAQRPLMFANPGLSGGRGPSCWPNNRRLKGERGVRGAAAPAGPAPDPAASRPGPQASAPGGSARAARWGHRGRELPGGAEARGEGGRGEEEVGGRGRGGRGAEEGVGEAGETRPLRLRRGSQDGRGAGAPWSQTGRAPLERDLGFQRRPWPGPSASLGI